MESRAVLNRIQTAGSDVVHVRSEGVETDEIHDVLDRCLPDLAPFQLFHQGMVRASMLLADV